MSAPQQHTGAYALAKWVANQLPHHPGATARELYQHYLPQFAEFGTDGSAGAAMISQHLRKLEYAGQVHGEKAKSKGNPTHWHWIGAIPDDCCATAEASSAVTHEQRTTSPQDGTGEPDGAESDAIRDTAEAAPDGPEAASDNDEPYQEPLGFAAADTWDGLARQFAQVCREQAAKQQRINDLTTKLAVLDRLIPIVSEDIAGVLSNIVGDLITLGGSTL